MLNTLLTDLYKYDYSFITEEKKKEYQNLYLLNNTVKNLLNTQLMSNHDEQNRTCHISHLKHEVLIELNSLLRS